MRVDIFAKNIELNEPLRVFVNEKMGDLDHLVTNLGQVHARVEIGKPSEHHRKGPIFYAEANLSINDTLLRADATQEDLRLAITAVKDELQQQIKKFKEKRRDLSRA